MKINPPVIITPRLLPGVAIGQSTISIDYSERLGDEQRTRYQYFLDLELDGKHFEFTGDDIQSGNNCNDTLQDGLRSLLDFMSACGESYGYAMRHNGKLVDDDGNASLFPENVAEWCYCNSDELSILAMELDEIKGLIVE